MTPPLDEPRLPAVPVRLRRPLVALWVSLAVHAALLGLIQLAPSGAPTGGEVVLQARLDPARPSTDTPPAPKPDTPTPTPQPSTTLETTETLDASPAIKPPPPLPEPPPARPVAPPSAQPSAPPVEPVRPVFAIESTVDLTYYSARELDKQAVPLSDIDFAYPPEADRTRVSGRVRVQIKVEADGRVSDIEVIEGTPPGVFDASALEAFRTVRFVPAQKAGRPVRALMLIEVTYDWAEQANGKPQSGAD